MRDPDGFYPSELVISLCQRQILIEGSFSRLLPQLCATKNLIRLLLKDVIRSLFSSP